MSIEIREGSILDFEGDAIVNPANCFMNHGAGLARIIANAAQPYGARLHAQNACADPESEVGRAYRWQQEHDSPGLTATGNVRVTSAGVLPFKGIIHAVGPIWNGGTFMEADLLDRLTERILEVSLERGWKSVALPAISCGIFGFPVDLAARIMLSVSWGWEPQFDTIAFYPFGYELTFLDAQERWAS
jgi:O-acetyl-ADP-ribose deacetylase (regulator of RNase III)